jgi:hypothetical protein
MEAEPGIAESIKTVPGVFYDLIVYYASSVTFLVGVTLLFISPSDIHKILASVSLFETALLIILGISFCYIWGQLSSAHSYYIIKTPISLIVKWLNGSSCDDYFFNRSRFLEDFPLLSSTEEKKERNYWTILYYIRVIKPHIADDLMKRYARCKLARVNAFNFLLLSVLHLILRWTNLYSAGSDTFSSFYQSIWMVLILLFLTLIFIIEFYQRQCWFGDIVIKIYAAIVKATTEGISLPTSDAETR